MERVRAYVVHVEGGRGVSRKVHTWACVIEEAEPRFEQWAVEVLHSFPQVFAHDVVEGLLEVA